MDNLIELFSTKFMNMLLMFGICFLFIFFLRFLYGPKGIFRKSLMKDIENEKKAKKEINNE